MDDATKRQIEDALETGFWVIAGDEMIWVDKDDHMTALIGMMEDVLTPSTTATVKEGVVTDQAGWTMGSVRKLTFLRKNLVSLNVVIDPSGHFLIDNERWDLCDKEPILEALVPLGGIQNLFQVVVRRSVELNNSVAGTEFTYG